MMIKPKSPNKKSTNAMLTTTVMLDERSRPWLNLSLDFDIRIQFVAKGIKKLFVEVNCRKDLASKFN